MQTRDAELRVVRTVPTAPQELIRKHREQMVKHEMRFGRLGQFMSAKQHAALKRALKLAGADQ